MSPCLASRETTAKRLQFAPRRINTEENVDLGTKNYYTQIVEIVRTNGWNCYEVIGYVDFIQTIRVIILKFIRIVFYRNLDGISGKKKYSKNIYSYSLYSRFKNTFLLPFSCDASNQAKSFFRKISFVKSSRKTFETIETLDSKAFNSYLSGNRGSSSFFQSYTLITREKRKTENNFREEYAKQ